MACPSEFFKSVTPLTDDTYFFLYEDFLDDDDTVNGAASSFVFPGAPIVGTPLPINTEPFTLKLPDGESRIYRVGTVAPFIIRGFVVDKEYLVVHNVVTTSGRKQSFTMTFTTFSNLP